MRRFPGILALALCSAFVFTAAAREPAPATSGEAGIPEVIPAPASAGVQTATSNLLVEDSFRIDHDGTYTETLTRTVHIDTVAGIDEWSSVRLPYSVSRQKVEVLAAWVVTPEGRRIQVAKDQIFTKLDNAGVGAPMFSDTELRIIVFPQLAVGATLHYRVRYQTRTPLFPGQFSDVEWYSRYARWDKVRLSFDYPADMPMHIEAYGMQDWTPPSPAGAGRRKVGFALDHVLPISPETIAPSPFVFSPRVFVSSFPAYAAIGDAYARRADAKAAVTPQVRALADKITAGISGQRAQAVALYEWVAKHIRYVAVYFGVGGIVPHAADTVLANGYGDCKDHVTLLQALLAAKGISSVGALIAAGGPNRPPRVAVNHFNHIITYLPEWKLFVDSTVGDAPFGELPGGDLGRQVVLVHAVANTPRVLRTPSFSASTNAIVDRDYSRVAADGTLVSEGRQRGIGAADIGMRGRFLNVRPGSEPFLMQSMLAARGLQGTGTMHFGNPLDFAAPFELRLSAEVPDFAQLPGPAALSIPGSGTWINVPGGNAARRQLPLACYGDARTSDTRLSFPPGSHFIAIPPDVSFRNAAGSYQARYRIEDDTVVAERRLSTSGNGLCPASMLADFQTLAGVIGKDQRAQVLYAGPGVELRWLQPGPAPSSTTTRH